MSLPILTIGDPRLERASAPVQWPDPALAEDLARLHQALAEFRRRSGFGRAIAAPQLGISKRVIALNLGATPFAVINPRVDWRSEETFEVWDDCLSVPEHVVRVRRHRSISLRYLDERGRGRHWQRLPPEMSELLQHEIDHLDGVLMTARAVDASSIRPIAERDARVGSARPAHRLSLEAIAGAARTIDPVFAGSPQYRCEPLCEALGCEVTLKVETVNPIRCFKGRGAEFLLGKVEERGDARALVCASAGNFGQALAWACTRRGRALTVYAARNASPLKVERMRALGAEVRLVGEDFDAAKSAARAAADAAGAWLVEDGREPEISEGAGSIAVELLSRGDAFDFVLVPLGGGAMLNGIARWFKAASPATRVVGVSARGADAMRESWLRGECVRRESMETVADGIGVRVPIPEAVADMAGQVDDVVLVGDQPMIESMRLLHELAGLVAEPAGAAGIAALAADRGRFVERSVAVVVSGGNLTSAQMGEWLGGGRARA